MFNTAWRKFVCADGSIYLENCVLFTRGVDKFYQFTGVIDKVDVCEGNSRRIPAVNSSISEGSNFRNVSPKDEFNEREYQEEGNEDNYDFWKFASAWIYFERTGKTDENMENSLENQNLMPKIEFEETDGKDDFDEIISYFCGDEEKPSVKLIDFDSTFEGLAEENENIGHKEDVKEEVTSDVKEEVSLPKIVLKAPSDYSDYLSSNGDVNFVDNLTEYYRKLFTDEGDRDYEQICELRNRRKRNEHLDEHIRNDKSECSRIKVTLAPYVRQSHTAKLVKLQLGHPYYKDTVIKENGKCEDEPNHTERVSKRGRKRKFPGEIPRRMTSVNLRKYRSKLVGYDEACLAWFRDVFEIANSGDKPIDRQNVFEEYLEYCLRNTVDPVDKAYFGKLIKKVFPAVRFRRLIVQYQGLKYHYAGIRYKKDE